MRLFFLISSLIYLQSNLTAHFYENPQFETELYDSAYVKAEDIIVAENGILLNLREGGSLPIRSLVFDGSGILALFEQSDQRKYTTYICPGCKRIYNWWESCNTPGCPQNPREKPHGG
jgi:hypothetical protein